jgi:hypothetical protein
MSTLSEPHLDSQPLLLRDFDADSSADVSNASQYRAPSGLLRTAALPDGGVRTTLQDSVEVEPLTVQQAQDPAWPGVFFRTRHARWPPQAQMPPADQWCEVEVSGVS